nr:hypothetical protein [Tanacetum cinerariifolium]
EPASPMKDVSEGEACPTESGFIADQDRATIAKRSINEGEPAAERISNDSEEVARFLTSMDAAIVLAGGIDVPTGSGFIPTVGPPATVISTGSEEETEKLKRKGLNLEKEQEKKQKLSEEAPEIKTSTEEFTKEKMKEMMQLVLLVLVEDVYVQALQVKHPIIDWKVYIEDLLKQLDREDLNQLWALVKEYLSIRPASSEKEMELWVELKRMYEQDPKDQLWTLTQNFMHAPVDWKLYDLSGVHHVTAKYRKIFMLVEKDYPLRKGLALVMISYKLQVENYSQMAEDLIRKI